MAPRVFWLTSQGNAAQMGEGSAGDGRSGVLGAVLVDGASRPSAASFSLTAFNVVSSSQTQTFSPSQAELK